MKPDDAKDTDDTMCKRKEQVNWIGIYIGLEDMEKVLKKVWKGDINDYVTSNILKEELEKFCKGGISERVKSKL